jgi:hypothetical protein
MKASETFYNIIDSNNLEISPFIELIKQHRIEEFTNAETTIFKAFHDHFNRRTDS